MPPLPDLPLPPVTSAAPIRASMDRQLSETLARLPPSSGRGFVTVDATNTGTRVEGAFRIRHGFDVGGWIGKARGQSAEWGTRASWRF